MRRILACLCAASMTALAAASAAERPSLIMTAEGVASLRRADIDRLPLLEASFEEAKARVERSIAEGIDVPVPKDPGGGYTHERHKDNGKLIQEAGALYQITGDRRYLDHARALLLAYAEMYPGLPQHPIQRNQAPGRLFWQSLNDAVFIVYTAQGYDAIAEALDAEARAKIESGLLRPAAEFLSVGNEETFRKIHNHGAWAAAAVGMTGYALGDQSLVERALLGLDLDGKTGFLAQLDQLFSPDGYYAEGPYYQRYAMMPFVLFAQAIDANEPERRIFERGDGVLLKAIYACIQQSYGGKFFPLNDAIKEKGLDTPELVYAVAAAYERTGDKGLLSIAQGQGKTVLTKGGLAVARDAAKGEAQAFGYRSVLLHDGPQGEQGGLAILRMGEGPLAQTLVMKNTSQGMGHGHLDKLSLLFYDNGSETLADYGAARFLNVPSKEGGRYLPENDSWAQQTVAHNTLVVDEQSQFGGDWRRSQESWPELIHFETGDALNVAAARIDDAYPGVVIERTALQVSHPALAAPVLVDIIRATGERKAQFDLPFHYRGQPTDFSGEIKANTSLLKPLGKANGYQHLWREATGRWQDGALRFSWLKDDRFYSLHALAPEGSEAVFVRTGANDPNFNLRSERALILRAPKQEAVTFVSVVEPHGVYNAAAEFTTGSESQFRAVEHVAQDGRDLVILRLHDGEDIIVAVSHDPAADARHRVETGEGVVEWNGFAAVIGEQQ